MLRILLVVSPFFLFSCVFACFPLFSLVFLCFSLFPSVLLCFYLFFLVFLCFTMFSPVFLYFSLFPPVFLCSPLFFSMFPSFLLLPMFSYEVSLFSYVFPCFSKFSLFSYIPGFLKTGLAKIPTHSTTWPVSEAKHLVVTLEKQTISYLSVSARIRVIDPLSQMKREYNTILDDVDSENRNNFVPSQSFT